MDDTQTPRALSHDEKLAAEAAFSGRPFNTKWSARARFIYEGIVKSLPASVVQEEMPAREAQPDMPEETGKAAGDGGVPTTRIPFHEAIAAGALIDVTATAKQVGLSFPVTVTKPLWEVGIAPSSTMTAEEQSARLRDILMAFRLRLATQPSVSPLIDFPALLAFPPNVVPQPIPLFALIQPDDQSRATVTLLLPNEVATTIIPLN